MIHIRTLKIEEFRGIRNLELDLAGGNFAICGPNGTGKSAVVDAIEFCLTGDITRLSGEGSQQVSVKAHAPHVDQRDHPENARVTIVADIPSLRRTATICRSVKNPRTFLVTPDEPGVRAVVDQLQTHPEFALSRREIVKYIITPPGKRSEDVQNLLRLEHLEKVRKVLTAFSNRRQSEAEASVRSRSVAETDLARAIGMPQFVPSTFIERVNEKRALLGLENLAALEPGTSLKAGTHPQGDEARTETLRKSPALADVRGFQESSRSPEPASLVDARNSAIKLLTTLREDDKSLNLIRRQAFIKAGLALVTDDACPLCDTAWEVDELRNYLRQKLANAEEYGAVLRELNGAIRSILDALASRNAEVKRVIEYCGRLEPLVEHSALSGYLDELKTLDTVLSEFSADPMDVDLALRFVSSSWWPLAKAQRIELDECQRGIAALPDTSTEEDARETLIVCQERYEKLIKARSAEETNRKRAAKVHRVLECYNRSSTAVLEGIYDQVAQNFRDYYRILNREDEDDFVCKLESQPAKLSLDVDFYGRGLFPPGAYHSEGHQDAMGLCLYLALMKHTLGEQFTFAVLDDVLMSVDTDHRREVCRLLKSLFPNTQFILTTHDRVWLQYMKTENLLGGSAAFGGWTVDVGPRVWEDHDVWSEIEKHLDQNQVAEAAFLLRYYLEHTAALLADNLRAPVEFRGDARYDLGDLLPRTLKQWRKWLEQAEKSAQRWGLKDRQEELAARRLETQSLISGTKAEEWAINPSVHFNQWANLSPTEFREVVNAFKELLEHLRCENPKCASYLYVSPRKGEARELRCNCGAVSFNLKDRA
jgi:RecF/RecN/SMC N terminal domain